MNRTLQLSVLMALAISVMVAAAEAEEGTGGSGPLRDDGRQAGGLAPPAR